MLTAEVVTLALVRGTTLQKTGHYPHVQRQSTELALHKNVHFLCHFAVVIQNPGATSNNFHPTGEFSFKTKS